MSLMLNAIHALTLQSFDKLYVIGHEDDASGWKTWYFVQIDMEETSEKLATKKRTIPQPTDARRKPVTQ